MLELGDSAAAQASLEEAVAINERVLGPDHAGLAQVLGSLANLAFTRGDQVTSRQTHERVLGIVEANYGTESLQYAKAANDIGVLIHVRVTSRSPSPGSRRAWPSTRRPAAKT